MDVPYCYYQLPNMKRKLGPDWYKQPGCQHQPIFDIPLENIIIDELHLMLRVMDKLETGLILELVDWDEVYNTAHFINFTLIMIIQVSTVSRLFNLILIKSG